MEKRIVILGLALTMAPISICSVKNAREIPTKKDKAIKKEARDKKNRYPIDTIIAVIPNSEGNKVITQSELDRPAIDGTMRSKKDLIRNARLYNKAKEYGMIPSESDIDDHLNTIKRENKMTHDDVVKLFDSAGYTFAEGREQLGEMSATSTLVNVKVHSRLLIPERDIRAYYHENPIYLEPEYQIQRGLIPFDTNIMKDEQREQIEAMLRSGKKISNVEWLDPFWIDVAVIDQDKMFIIEMKPGEVRLIEEVDNFELFKLVNAHERRLKPFEERYTEIADILRRPRYERLFAEFEQQLEAQMPVIDLEASDVSSAG